MNKKDFKEIEKLNSKKIYIQKLFIKYNISEIELLHYGVDVEDKVSCFYSLNFGLSNKEIKNKLKEEILKCRGA